jgi:hypothetical protein
MTNMGARQKGGDIGTAVMRSTIAYGRFVSWVSLIIGISIGLFAIGLGVKWVQQKTNYTGSAQARVLSAECSPRYDGTRKQFDCALNVQFSGNEGTTHTGDVRTTVGEATKPGSTISVRYDPGNPSDIVTGWSVHTWGMITIGVGILVGGGSVLTWYAAQNYDVAAAATGAGSAWQILSGR